MKKERFCAGGCKFSNIIKESQNKKNISEKSRMIINMDGFCVLCSRRISKALTRKK